VHHAGDGGADRRRPLRRTGGGGGCGLATWLRCGDRPRVRWLLVGAVAVLLLYLVPAGIARSAYQY
jgi:hypothetical protein